MQELDDIALLQAYVARNSEEAFATLVTRHVNKVYSVAYRLTRNPHQAEEIAQAVFVLLARKARRLGKRVILSGWLYQAARLTAATSIRSAIRRARREQEAHMQTVLNENESDAWTQIAPLLDGAIAGLNEADRNAVVLRFFDGKSMKEVGAALGANESAAILATGTTVVVNRIIAQDSAVDDSAWPRIDTQSLQALPPSFVLRPTHFATHGPGLGGGMVRAGNRMLGRAISFDALMGMAYDMDLSRVVAPADKPSGHYDLLVTGPDDSSERLRAEIKRQLGYAAHLESRGSDALLLTLKQPNAPGLRPSEARNSRAGVMSSISSSRSAGDGTVKTRSINSQNQPIPNLVKNLQVYFDKPILDCTGLTGNNDISLDDSMGAGGSESDVIMRALSAQLGLELVPGHESIEMLVVERAK